MHNMFTPMYLNKILLSVDSQFVSFLCYWTKHAVKYPACIDSHLYTCLFI